MANEADLLIEAGFSDAKLARESAKVIGMFKDAGTKAEKAFQSAVNSVGGSERVKAHGRELEKLKLQFDPLYAATKRYEAEVEKLNRLHAAGGIGVKEYGTALTRLKSQKDAAAGSASRFGGALGNVGFQIGDFATQVGAGTSATQALGQQLPQLLGAFGAFGAIAGAAAAIMIPLGSAILKTAFDSETLEERMKALEASTDAMKNAADAAATPISELRDKYGDLADEVARANGAMAMMTAIQAERDAIGTVKGLSKDFGFNIPAADSQPVQWNGQVNLDRQRMAIKAQEDAVDALREKTGATEEQFERLRMAINRTDSSNSLEAVANDAANLSEILAVIAQNDGITDVQFRRLTDWAAQSAAVAQQAQRQIEAERSQREKLLDTYDKTTREMASLADDLAKAEAERAKALAVGKAEEVAQWDRVIAKIREMVYETRAAASETDTLFERMAKGAKSFLEQGNDFAGQMAGRIGASNAMAIGKQYEGMGEKPNRQELQALVGVDPATVYWCAAFMNAVLGKAGVKGTGSLAARSFLDWGEATNDPRRGDVVVLQRGKNPDQGHVGFYDGRNDDGTIRVFGGNQGNKVGTSNFRASDVLGYRRAPVPDRAVDRETALEEDRIARAAEAAKADEKAAEARDGFTKSLDKSADAMKRSAASASANADALGLTGKAAIKAAGDAAYLAKQQELLAAAENAKVTLTGDQKAEVERQAQAARTNAELAEEVKQRRAAQTAAKELSATLAKDLLTTQEQAKLDKDRADAIYRINAAEGTKDQKAAAIAKVNAEYEKQKSVMMLTAEAKRRNVDMDALVDASQQKVLAGLLGLKEGTIRYKDAVAALGEQEAQRVLISQQQDAAADKLKQSQEFAAQQTQALKDGLVDAIVEGENFSDVLANVAKSLAKAALQAALFGQGPMDQGGGGLLGLFFGGFGRISGDPLDMAIRGALGGARASGGPVSAGVPYLVGERGPEIVVPRSVGNVIPNHKLGGHTFAPSTSIVIQGSADERTLALMQRELDARDRRLARQLPGQVNQINRDPLRR